ncbi:MAG TPA: saccharopine dehydrogenase NADP-binding domain-containing protein, partial [Solirubrobacterales bacterium]|nr:saccharopine dehydrogenase NADP-binding domain-containing protein [Solirubrobacterales bacterium]
MPEIEVVVVGAAGARAQAMLEIVGRAGTAEGWLAVDRHWRGSERHACERLGMRTVELDLLEHPQRLRDLIDGAALVVNLAGPAHRTGPAVLDACIEGGCDYMDICEDPDATVALLARDAACRAAGVRALIGMGATPGLPNVLARAGVEWLGGADEINVSWIVDVADVDQATLEQGWRLFAPIEGDGRRGAVPAWEELALRSAEFPAPFGERLVVALACPWQITVPRFLGIETVRSYGSIVPEESLVLNWALARLGAADEAVELRLGGPPVGVPPLATELYERYLAGRVPAGHLGSGLVVDVWSGEEGVRFASVDPGRLAESAAAPLAAGIALMLEGGPGEPGL